MRARSKEKTIYRERIPRIYRPIWWGNVHKWQHKVMLKNKNVAFMFLLQCHALLHSHSRVMNERIECTSASSHTHTRTCVYVYSVCGRFSKLKLHRSYATLEKLSTKTSKICKYVSSICRRRKKNRRCTKHTDCALAAVQRREKKEEKSTI